MNKTPNYQLNQWEAEDKVQRVDFNADNAKIDAALKSLRDFVGAPLRFASGSYRGTGARTHTIQMGLSPKLAVVFRMDGYEQKLTYFTVSHRFSDRQNLIGLQLPSAFYTCTPTENGLTVSCTSEYLGETRSAGAACNTENVSYAWFAIGV